MLGALARNHVGPPPTDPYWSDVQLLVQGESGIVDAKGHTLSLTGSIATGTTYVPSGAIEFESGKFFFAASATDFTPGAGAFCWEAFVVGAATGLIAYQTLMATTGNGSYVDGMVLENAPERGVFWGENNSGLTSFNYNTYTPTTEQHIYVSRTAAGAMTIGVAGTIEAALTNTKSIASLLNGMRIGALTSGVQDFKGSMRWIRYTQGQHRYTGSVAASYTVPTLPLPTS